MVEKVRRTYTFLLLELLVAISLFSLCIIPLASIPMYGLGSEIQTYQRLQLQRLADVEFAMIKGELYQNAIKWEQLDASKGNKAFLHKNDQVSFQLKGINQRLITSASYVYSTSRKAGKEQEQYRLVNVEIKFTTPSRSRFFLFNDKHRNSVSFHYQVFVQQQSQAPVQDSATSPANVNPLMA